MLRMNDDNVSHYSKETNAEKSAGLVVHLYRIVPHIPSAVFSSLYMGKRSAIEILLIKQEPCFPNAWKTHTRRCGDFRSKPMNLFSLVKHHVYNKVYPCVCFCKGNCS